MSVVDFVFGSVIKSDWNLGLIFDFDVYIDLLYDMWKDYFFVQFRDCVLVIEYVEDCDYIVFEGNCCLVMMINNQVGCDGKNFKMKGCLVDQCNIYDLVKWFVDMDFDGIDQVICFGGGLLGSFDNDFYIVSFEVYSCWVMDWVLNVLYCLFLVGYVLMCDIDEMIVYVDWLVKMGFWMVQFLVFLQNVEVWKILFEIKNFKLGVVLVQIGDFRGVL